jgi:hypothetical protein
MKVTNPTQHNDEHKECAIKWEGKTKEHKKTQAVYSTQTLNWTIDIDTTKTLPNLHDTTECTYIDPLLVVTLGHFQPHFLIWKLPSNLFSVISLPKFCYLCVFTSTKLATCSQNNLYFSLPSKYSRCVQTVLLHVMMYRGSRGTAPLFLNIGTRWSVELHLPAWYQLVGRLGACQNRSGLFQERKNFLRFLGQEPLVI